jgi:FixJ family two-component response regulator
VGSKDSIVFILDDDRRICEALSELLSTYDLHTVTFGSATEYMPYPKPEVPACLILDVELPDVNGLDLQIETVAALEHVIAVEAFEHIVASGTSQVV